MWTTGQDRQLVCASLSTGAVALALPTLGGFVYCVAASRLDAYKVALGVGDGTIRVWNLASAARVEMTHIWMKINGKVSSVSRCVATSSMIGEKFGFMLQKLRKLAG